MDPATVNSEIANPQATVPMPFTAPNPALAQLQDIIHPEPIGAWPWAIGYWLVLALVIALITLLVIWLRQRARDLAPKKAAKQLLNQLDKQATSYASDVNSLLKRTAMSYLSREAIASLDGEAWAAWLDSYLPEHKRQRIGPLLAKRHQATPLTLAEANELHQLAQAWLASKAKLSAPEPNLVQAKGYVQASGDARAKSQAPTQQTDTEKAEAQC
ncbi:MULTISPECIES: DUF4381 domain-containing protein [unclassified Shewanella]|uniref:DUF4381 domain-containing protein n=1 Tax=Shewanella TaxID=22 RepID=UPI000DE93307|nr:MULTISPECIES: DUF4381 domain-containing protein [unclassified Shewanella]MCU8003562.1 DUF4381 domain-containing protein [Shewanella sp. SM96]MCU8039114.1 DUF4381 domain-containing protein [Shewanella sp. SM69]MCU8061837.1 DUF4381 domain-containing protein [Shewanella sp. SM55]RBP77787.1 uncharacterized protein DUF4381 [Shewanella putrefaciens]